MAVQIIDKYRLFQVLAMILQIVKFAKCLDFCVKAVTG